MRLIEKEPLLTQRELARRLGVSLGGINYCIKALIEKGWVKADNFRKSDKKLSYAYLLTPAGVRYKTILTGQFLRRKLREYEDLRIEIDLLRTELDS